MSDEDPFPSKYSLITIILNSDEYDRWSDSSSEVYDVWSDCGSDIYDFWSDVKGEIWDDDLEKAQKKIENFKEDIDKLKSELSVNE